MDLVAWEAIQHVPAEPRSGRQRDPECYLKDHPGLQLVDVNVCLGYRSLDRLADGVMVRRGSLGWSSCMYQIGGRRLVISCGEAGNAQSLF